MGDVANFFGYEFEAEYNLFASEFEPVAAVYVVYTPKVCLTIGQTENLQETMETHPDTREWILKSDKQQVYIAFHPEKEYGVRQDIVAFLTEKMHPIVANSDQ